MAFINKTFGHHMTGEKVELKDNILKNPLQTQTYAIQH